MGMWNLFWPWRSMQREASPVWHCLMFYTLQVYMYPFVRIFYAYFSACFIAKTFPSGFSHHVSFIYCSSLSPCLISSLPPKLKYPIFFPFPPWSDLFPTIPLSRALLFHLHLSFLSMFLIRVYTLIQGVGAKIHKWERTYVTPLSITVSISIFLLANLMISYFITSE